MVERDALIAIRHDFGPGDVGEITMLYAEVYTAEFGWDHRFERYVARMLGEFAERQPHERERIWIAEADDAIVGCIAIVDEGKVSHSCAGTSWIESVMRESWGRPVVEERYVLSLERIH